MTDTFVPMPDHPLNVLVTKTLTLPEVTPEDEAMIAEAAEDADDHAH